MQSPWHGDGVVTCNLETHCLSASDSAGLCQLLSIVFQCVLITLNQPSVTICSVALHKM